MKKTITVMACIVAVISVFIFVEALFFYMAPLSGVQLSPFLLLFFNISFGLVLLLTVWSMTRLLYEEHRKHQVLFVLLEDSLESMTSGFLYFSSDETLQKSNKQAYVLIPELQQYSDELSTIDGFFGFLLSNSSDLEQDMEDTLSNAVSGSGMLDDVQAVIERNGRTSLIQAQKTRTGGLAVIVTDVTDLKRKQEDLLRLNRENHELIQAVEATSKGIAISDFKHPANRVVFANKAFLEMTGLSKEDVVGRGWPHILSMQGQVENSDVLLQDLKEQKTVTMEWCQQELEPPEWFELTVSPVYDEKGAPDLFIGLLSNTTEMKLQKAQFYQAQKLEALGQLAGGVAHDFNNLLSIIDGYARMASKVVEDESDAKNYLERVQQAAGRGASLTKQLLTFGRHKILTESVTDLGQLVQEQENLMVPLLDASIDLLINWQDNVLVSCGQDALSQILLNLVINARDAMDDGGSIIVEASACVPSALPNIIPSEERGNSFAMLSVSDTGTGMDQQTINRIFDPFFTTKEQGKGTGLGLSMVYGMVQQMGGYIDVHSVTGQGTSMRLYLPVSDKAVAKGVHETEDNAVGIRFDGYTALVAEDEEDLLFVVCHMLEDLGMTVISAANGNEALLKQDDHEGGIDFLLTDVVMPELNGVKLAELMLAVRPDTKVVFMSGYPANGQMARVQLPEEACLLAKPVRFEMLAQLLHQQIKGQSDESSAHGQEMGRWHEVGE